MIHRIWATLRHVWADYLDHHRSTPIIITTAGIIGPVPPEWHNQTNTT